jgi:phosphate transport system regulatory protein PhoU
MQIRHLSTQFDRELNDVSKLVLQLGGLVEEQVINVLDAFAQLSRENALKTIEIEKHVNQLELRIDFEAIATIARRQPTARDLRLLIAIAKATTDLERIGDEAERIAELTLELIQMGHSDFEILNEIKNYGQEAVRSLNHSLDAFARLDVETAATLLQSGQTDERKADRFIRKIEQRMKDGYDCISACIAIMQAAKAIERIRDHADNIAEFTIYIVKGADIRHLSADELTSVIG